MKHVAVCLLFLKVSGLFGLSFLSAENFDQGKNGDVFKKAHCCLYEMESDDPTANAPFYAPVEPLNSEVFYPQEGMCGASFSRFCLPDFCLEASYMLGKGVGYHKGYGSLGVWTFFSARPDFELQPFIDVRGHVFDDGKFAANVGIGSRYFLESWNATVGLNAYYDFRQGRYSDFNQVGVGAEMLGECWDLRINGYFPVGNQVGSKRKVFDDYIGDDVAICIRKERTLTGFDAEVGYYFIRQNPCGECARGFELYGAIGPYYFTSDYDSNIWGGEARVVATVMKYLRAEVIATSDRVFHQRVQGRFGVEFPLGGKFWCSDESDCCSLPYCQCDCNRVQRREIIALDGQCCWETNYGGSCGSNCSSSSGVR